ncbi:MAG: carboxypeptidase M32, partial [Phycisphaerales bacterium]
MSTASAYLDLVTHFKQASLLQGTSAILSWDQETMMPAGGVEFRGEQLAQLAGLVHRLKSEPRLGDLLDRAAEETGSDPLSPEAVNVREWRLDRDRAMKLPESLVEELARVSSVAQHEWAEARRDSDFAKFRPWLEKLLELNRRQAECLGWDRASGEPWDALGDLYEPGLTAKEIESIFTPLGDRLKRLVAEIADAPRRPDDRFDRLELPEAQQEAFVRFVAESIGFDFTRGRLDRSTHPFCGGSHRNDVRLTTRFRKDLTLDALGSTMHECGHGIYAQGLPGAHLGTP